MVFGKRGSAQSALLLIAALAVLAAAAPARAGDKTASSREVSDVLELFTSQGCSSCPPADALLTRYSQEPGILALAYHVDYWDYIGWQDVLGSRKNTERQRGYAVSFGSGSIYTPQMVVNGRRDVVGSRRADIEKAVAETGLEGGKARIELRVVGDRLHVFAEAPAPAEADATPVLMLVTFDDESRTAISRGENSGREAINSHSVRDWRALGLVSGKPMDLDIPVSMLVDPDGRRTGCAVFLQAVEDGGEPGEILAAATLEFGD